jgi:hypothetical protein
MTAPPVFIPLVLMALAIAAALSIGGLFFLKQSGERRANRLYGALLLLAGFTQLHFALDFGGWMVSDPWLRYLPIYFSLWLPVLLFSHVKISLYPFYKFLIIWLLPSLRHEAGRYFYNPFYGGLEQALFLIGWPIYVLFSVLYLRRKRALLNKRSLPRPLWYLRKLLKGVLLFILAYAILSVADVLASKYLLTDLRSRVWYAGAQALSFTVLLLWLCVYGGQVLVWGRALRVAVRWP